jgi:hypothetical protein
MSDDEAFIARYGRKTFDEVIGLKFADGTTPDHIFSYEDEAGVRGQTLVGPPQGPSEPVDSRPPYKRLKIRNVYTLRPAPPTSAAAPAAVPPAAP